MIGFEMPITGLLVISTLTGLVTEAIKKILAENNISYKANTLAGIVSVVLSIVACVGYAAIYETGFTSEVVVCSVAITFLSWLCSMIGYDKVMQTISQFKMDRKGDE